MLLIVKDLFSDFDVDVLATIHLYCLNYRQDKQCPYDSQQKVLIKLWVMKDYEGKHWNAQ